MKTCNKCKNEKDNSEFFSSSFTKDGLSYYCKTCDGEIGKSYYQKNKEKIKKQTALINKKAKQTAREYVSDYLLDHPCAVCGEPDIIVLEFDHLRDKKVSISQLINRGSSIKMIQAEIDKCQVLCSNCHKRKTAQESKWYKLNHKK